MKRRSSAAAAALILAAMAATGAEAADTRRFAIDDALAIKTVSDPRISPDGAWIAYVVEVNDLEADEKRSRIYMVSRDGETRLAMTGETYSASDPRWSPDGRYLSFLAARDDLDYRARTQVYTLNRRGGEAEAYTDIPQGVDGYEWSPKGDRMLLVITDETEEAKEDREREEDGDEPPARPFVIDRLQFKEDGVGYLDRSRAHLFVQEGRLGETLRLTRGDFDHSEPSWSPDGTMVAFVSNRTNEPDSNLNTDIFVVDATGKAGAARRITDNPGTDLSPAWSPDGTRIAFLSQTDPKLFWYASQHVAIAPVGGGLAQLLTDAADRNFFSPRFSADGKKIYALLEDSGEQPVVAVDALTGAVERIVAGEHAVFAFDVDAKGAVAAQLSRPTLPDEIFLAAGGAMTNLSKANDALLAGLRLSAPINATFKSADGTEIEGFFYPPTSGHMKKAPAILRIHGGPTSQFDYSFDAYAQVYAAAGYLVVMTNPRGSTGYGTPFASAIFADWGNKDYDDVLAGVDHAVAQGWADEKRLGVGGWSYGGILTNFIITRTNRFKAAVTGASGLNYLANYGHDIYQREYELELGLPWERPEVWEKLNKFARVDRVETPTLIIGGEEDWNVPILNSEQLYQALKRRGIDTGLIVYPDEDHSIDRPSFYKDRFERYRGWYDKYLK